MANRAHFMSNTMGKRNGTAVHRWCVSFGVQPRLALWYNVAHWCWRARTNLHGCWLSQKGSV